MENQKIAENERLKGNEFVKSKEYAEAVRAYSRSIELNENEPYTYANRAMAFLKQKCYRQAADDATKAIELKPGYLKAHHRRGKAYLSLNKFEEAIKDFQYILENEPENKDVNKDLQTARKSLKDQAVNEKLDTNTSKAGEEKSEPAAKGKFRRVAIEEDSDEEDEEPKIEEVAAVRKMK